MGAYKSKCKKCGEEILGDNSLIQMFKEKDHEQKKHPKIFAKNKAADLKFNEDYKKINDEKIYSQEVIFTPSKWDACEYA